MNANASQPTLEPYALPLLTYVYTGNFRIPLTHHHALVVPNQSAASAMVVAALLTSALLTSRTDWEMREFRRAWSSQTAVNQRTIRLE